MKTLSYPSVLSIAGFDGSGGAGLQADIKTISALGCYATTVLTALPVQNTTGVTQVFPIPAEVVEAQLLSILSDIPPHAIKIGMVHNTAIVALIAKVLKNFPQIPIILDPVMLASSGDTLIKQESIQALQELLFPLAAIITPNLDEASLLTGKKIDSLEKMYLEVPSVMALGVERVLLKGGHLNTEVLTSLYLESGAEPTAYEYPKLHTLNTHGTGCSLASAIASKTAVGYKMETAVALAQDYVYRAIEAGKDVKTGAGHGPLNHFFDPKVLKAYPMRR